ncbi:phosphotransferase [Sporosarcina sp. G11-34]|uniref:phosphotransferase n=1 Tax=Sporosarcina sp. G11-34 TaxID=2849605 RepID=UPI0022A9C0B3|nr:phosphotransferase [Sporosarcina sp. G11-34]MCZ2258398.1 aminoglycoside phosphotransferase family protein [Sporosarcina sp. G11-34]
MGHTERRMITDGKLKKIKENVWKLEREGACFSVKQYYSSSVAVKVNHIHDVLGSVSFPHIVPVVPTEDSLIFIQPWLDGVRPVNFKKRADRTDSLAALQGLHETKSRVDWAASVYLHPYPLVEKWEERISRFRKVSVACEEYIGKSAVDEILFYAVNALSIVKKTYRDHLDGTLLHGDVVHHNILRDKDGIIRFIDFDLASTGPAGTEIALWVHRVLPQIEYDIEFLINEQPSLQKLDDSSKSLLLFPNELLREWLHFFTLSPTSQEKQVKNLLPFTKSALSHWPKLWYNVERMKN